MKAVFGPCLLILSVCPVFGQPAEETPAFEVASVKLNTSGAGEGKGRETIVPSPSGVTMKNVHLKSVVGWAYHLQAIQITGPSWIDNDSYDIVAKAAGEVSRERLRLMTQTLLAERFKMTFHRDTKEMLSYVVTIAKSGSKLKESQGPGEMDVKPNGRMGASFSHTTLTQLTEMASSRLQGVVVDQTGLKGSYDLTLDMSGFLSGDFHPSSMDDVVNILIQAANDQLGIKIEQKKAPADRLTVDHVERVPAEN
jgi:uncharacterized protein (TIGR03435 family)